MGGWGVRLEAMRNRGIQTYSPFSLCDPGRGFALSGALVPHFLESLPNRWSGRTNDQSGRETGTRRNSSEEHWLVLP